MKVAINGFGRIGRAAFKALLNKKGIEVVGINDLTDTKTLAHLLKYDSCYGEFKGSIGSTADSLLVKGRKYRVYAEKDPGALPWKALGVDVVIESTGRFTDKAGASMHLKGGAKKVIISAPAKGGGVKTIVLGVNEDRLGKNDKVISMASCTTNCSAPLTAVILKNFGIKKAIMTTIHSYTADQNLVDGPHKDLRRTRAAAVSMIPTSTGAAKVIGEIFPELKGKLDGLSIRVPTPDVSLVDFVAECEKETTKEAVNAAFKKAADGNLKKYLDWSIRMTTRNKNINLRIATEATLVSTNVSKK